MGRLFIVKDVKTAADIRTELADPVRHWRAGYSAYEVAHAWTAHLDALPPIVQDLFDQHPPLAGAELVEAFFERKVDIGTPGRPSQSDVLAYCTTPHTCFVVAVEGKVKEPFGPYVRDRAPDILRDARLLSLCEQLGLAPADAAPLRYQLLHRAVSAVREAERYSAPHAILLVHSFDPAESSLNDYQRFAGVLGLPTEKAVPGRVCGPTTINGIHFHLAWVTDTQRAFSSIASTGCDTRDFRQPLSGRIDGESDASSGRVPRASAKLGAVSDDSNVSETSNEADALAGLDQTVRGFVMRIRNSPAPDEMKATSSISSNVSSGFKKRTGGRDYKAYYDLGLRRAIAELGALGGAPLGTLVQLVVALKDEDSDQKWNVINACRRDK